MRNYYYDNHKIRKIKVTANVLIASIFFVGGVAASRYANHSNDSEQCYHEKSPGWNQLYREKDMAAEAEGCEGVRQGVVSV